MELETLINALKAAEAAEKSGLPAVGLSDYQHGMRPYGTRGFNDQALGTWSQYSQKLKETELTPNHTTLYGCTGLFSICGPDEVIGLSMNDDKLVAWMDWRSSNVCEQFVKFLTYMDAEGTAAGSPQSLAGAPCDNPPTAEKGTFEIFLGDKGLLRVSGQPIELTKIGERKCDKQPTYTLPIPGAPAGVRIDNDLDFEAIVAAQALKHEISRDVITGNKTSTGEFDGLEQLVNTGYTDVKTGLTNSGIDSQIVAWANDNMDGAINGKGNIVKWLTHLIRRIRHRVRLAGKGDLAVGDMVVVMPSFLRDCFLDAWACYGLCEPSQYNEIFRDNLAVREFRDRFNGGLFGDGYFTVDGVPVPIVAHDWIPYGQSGTKFTSDIYILTKRIGSTPVLFGQYHPMSQAVDVARQFGMDHFRTLQGDRMIQWSKSDNLCVNVSMAIKPNVYLSAPWAQARITNVGCTPLLAPLSDDPQSSYFVNSKRVADPIIQYFYKHGGLSGSNWLQDASAHI